MGSVPRRQRDGPVARMLAGLPPYDASEAVDGVVDLTLDDDLCARVKPWWDPSGQTAVDGSEVTDGGWFRAEETLKVRPCSHRRYRAVVSALGVIGRRAVMGSV